MDWNLHFLRDIAWDSLEETQRQLIAEVQKDPHVAHLLISEPRPTLTYGRSAQPTDLLQSAEWLKAHHIQVAPVSRGGQWTFHGPGQILIYPILFLPSLPSFKYSTKTVHRFVHEFRSGVERVLRDLGCLATEHEKPLEPFGIYSGGKKLASFGFAFQRGISSHGMALYLKDQSFFFSAIHPCGVRSGTANTLTTSLEAICGKPLSWDCVATSLGEGLKNHFSLGVTQVL